MCVGDDYTRVYEDVKVTVTGFNHKAENDAQRANRFEEELAILKDHIQAVINLCRINVGLLVDRKVTAFGPRASNIEGRIIAFEFVIKHLEVLVKSENTLTSVAMENTELQNLIIDQQREIDELRAKLKLKRDLVMEKYLVCAKSIDPSRPVLFYWGGSFLWTEDINRAATFDSEWAAVYAADKLPHLCPADYRVSSYVHNCTEVK